MRYRVPEDAERDLDEIFVYWATRASLEASDRVVDRITERFWLLGGHPDASLPGSTSSTTARPATAQISSTFFTVLEIKGMPLRRQGNADRENSMKVSPNLSAGNTSGVLFGW
jgi:plasmid stabilization system protein ParE